MKDILLVTTSERVKVVFQSLERRGEVTVRVATSLSLARLAVSLGTPDCTFVEISADSFDIQVEEIPALLPEDANLAVLSDGSVDITWARKRSLPVIDLDMGDEALRAAISTAVDRAGAAMAPDYVMPEVVDEFGFGKTIEVEPPAPLHACPAPPQPDVAAPDVRSSARPEVDWSRFPTVRDLLLQEAGQTGLKLPLLRRWNWRAICISLIALAALSLGTFFHVRSILALFR